MAQTEVLILEDNNEYRLFLKSILEKRYKVTDFDNADSARIYLQDHRPQVILLDIGLKESDGFSFCSELKKLPKMSKIPVLFLTSKMNLEDKLTGFSIGADDYLVKPVDPLELIARLQVAIRNATDNNSHDNIIESNNVRIDFGKLRATRLVKGEEIQLNLTPTEFKILSFFLKNKSKSLTREQILTEVWGQNTHVVDRAIDTHIHTLRKKMEEDANLIQSVFGEGYRFA